MKAVKLLISGNGFFHFGKTSLTESELVVHSDTLFSTICNNLRSLYGAEKLEELKPYLTSKLQISSIFHFFTVYKVTTKEEIKMGTLFFFPKPFIEPKVKSTDSRFFENELKKWKKIQFISKAVLESIANDEAINFKPELILGDKYLISEEDFRLLALDKVKKKNLKEILKKRLSFIQEQMEQKVFLSRFNSQSEDTFHQGNILLAENHYYVVDKETSKRWNFTIKPGMFFLLADDDAPPKEILAAIKLIPDNGLGGERSTGKGLFDGCEIVDFSFAGENEGDSSSPKGFLSLSNVIPKKEEINSLVSYTLKTRRGFITSFHPMSLRKRAIISLSEGSVFSSKIEGQVVDVSPRHFKLHEIFRYGRAFLIPLKNYQENVER